MVCILVTGCDYKVADTSLAFAQVETNGNTQHQPQCSNADENDQKQFCVQFVILLFNNIVEEPVPCVRKKKSLRFLVSSISPQMSLRIRKSSLRLQVTRTIPPARTSAIAFR